MKHFFVCFVIVERYYWDTVVYLKCKTINTIINNNYVFKVPISKDSEIFNIIALRCKITMLSIQPMLNIFVVWINIVQYCVSVYLVTCGEYNYLKVFICFF
jgi:hypothetical protein